MQILRTPDECFQNLPDFPFAPNYLEIQHHDGASLRFHYLDEGNPQGKPVLLLHGEPSWCFLYRKMIPILAKAGFRVLAPDLIGFGRSDKPSERSDYTYQNHVDWMTAWFLKLKLENVALFCQDWGGLIGLRLAAENQERFSHIVAANTGLPTGEHKLSEAFFHWRKFSQEVPEFPIDKIMQMGCVSELTPDILKAYQAPFPEERFKAGARAFPALVPSSPEDPAGEPNRKAWEVLKQWHKPFLTAFSDFDPVTKGGERVFQKLIPGTQGQEHTIIENAGHFLQEDQGEKLAQVLLNFLSNS